MKKVLMALGGIFFVILLAIGGMGLFSWYKSSQYEDTAVPYIVKIVPEISKLDPEITKKYMVPKVMEEITNKILQKSTNTFPN